MESEILRLVTLNRTHDALSLYRSIWDYDDRSRPGSKSQRNNPRAPAKPTTRLMNHAIHACAECEGRGMLEEAFAVLEFALEGGKRGVRRLSPNVYTFGALVKVCAGVGDVERCVGLIQQMRVS